MSEPRGSKSIIAVQSKRRWGVNWLKNMLAPVYSLSPPLKLP